MPGGCVVFCRCVVSCTVSCTVPCITAVLLSVGYRASNACGYPNAADGATPFPTFRRAVGVLLVLSLFGVCPPARPHKNRGAYPHQIAEALPLPRPFPPTRTGGGAALQRFYHSRWSVSTQPCSYAHEWARMVRDLLCRYCVVPVSPKALFAAHGYP